MTEITEEQHRVPDHRLAHDLEDATRTRSKDVVLAEDVTFQDLHLSEKTFLGLTRCGFLRPSPIQLDTIPIGRCGFDLIVQSKAGTGKTCIFSIVALEALQFNENNSTQTLIITPTREIAAQIHNVITHLGWEFTNLRCALCIGGVDVKKDRQFLAKSCQIVIGTPGRIKQLIDLNVINTRHIELFVLDEADKLMDEQFKSQINNIYKRLPADKQMIATSATYPNELSHFLQRYMRAPKSILMGTELHLEAIEEYYVESEAGHSSRKNLEFKIHSLKTIVNRVKFSKCFIFTNFQARAPIICDSLNKEETFLAEYGTTSYLCAELPQSERNKVFEDFKKDPKKKLLVSTDISARGIDIQEVELVINFDLPPDNTTYYHRVGRAGRFGQPGMAVSIVSKDSVDRRMFETKVKSDKINKLSLD